jgi:hypothetical protein
MAGAAKHFSRALSMLGLRKETKEQTAYLDVDQEFAPHVG